MTFSVSTRLKPAITAAFIALMVVLWSTPAIRGLLQAEVLGPWLDRASQDTFGIVFVLVIMVGLGLAFVPLTALLLVCGFIWSWPYSFFLSQVMAVSIASILYYWGLTIAPSSQNVSEEEEGPMAHRHLRKFSQKIKTTTQHIQTMNLSLPSLVLLRMLPISHFGIVSLCLGVIKIPLRRFMVATILGQSPMSAFWVLVGERARLGLEGFDSRTLITLMILAATPWVVIFTFKKVKRA